MATKLGYSEAASSGVPMERAVSRDTASPAWAVYVPWLPWTRWERWLAGPGSRL